MSGALRALAVIGIALFACSADPLPGFRPASADERAALLQIVVAYYDLLDKAIVSGDIAPLYQRHPALAQGSDQQRGINAEGGTLQLPSVRERRVREALVEIQSYEPFRAFLNDEKAVAYSHGLLTWTYANGSQTKGELMVRFDLQRDGTRWTIVRTDERVLGETPAPTPR